MLSLHIERQNLSKKREVGPGMLLGLFRQICGQIAATGVLSSLQDGVSQNAVVLFGEPLGRPMPAFPLLNSPA